MRGILQCFITSGYRKSFDKRGKGYQDFPSKVFCLTVPKNVVGEHFRVSVISSIKKFYVSEVYVTIFDFLSKFFCLTMLRISVGGNPLVFH